MKPVSPLFVFLASLATTSPAAVPGTEYRYRVFLDDKPIGQHDYRITDRDGAFRVESRASFDVDFLFVNAYRYRHASNELWRNGCLQEIDAETDDNGDRYEVRGRLVDGRFQFSGSAGGTVAESGCLMTFAYWNPDFLHKDRLLNAQTGEIEEVRARRQGTERIRVGQVEVPAVRYRLETAELSLDLWYAEDLGWVGLRSETPRGGILTYRRM